MTMPALTEVAPAASFKLPKSLTSRQAVSSAFHSGRLLAWHKS